MQKIIFTIFILIHGVIHMLGFVKAFNIAKVEQLLLPISRPVGVLWLVTAAGFAFSAILFTGGKSWWGFVAIPAVALSQILIFLSWSDAKFGTIPNLIILFAAVVSIGSFMLQNRFQATVKADLAVNNLSAREILTEADIARLPAPVQKYLRYTKSVGQPKVSNFRAEFTGGMRGKPEQEYMKLHSVQYNFYHKPSRYFFMTASQMGLPATGLHIYQNETATFDVKLLNVYPVVAAKGEKLNQAETVTLLNDMCFIAPAALIDERITWQTLDNLSARAVFKNGGYEISATLFFNDKGELVNFISNDRYETDGKKYENYPWETPVSDYREMNGYLLPSKAKLVYKKPGGDFTYGELEYKDVQYNVTEFRW